MGSHVARARDDKDAFGLPQNLPVEVGPVFHNVPLIST